MGKKQRGKAGNKKKMSPAIDQPEIVFTQVLMEILCEYQTKYSALYDISNALEHRPLDTITCTVFERLTHVCNSLKEPMNCYFLSSAYRHKHPHKEDFAFVQSVINKSEEELGRPLVRITMEMLTQPPEYISESNKFDKPSLHSAVVRVMDPIVAKIEDHIDSLNMDIHDDTEEQAARLQVREALKKNCPLISQLFHHSLLRALTPNMKIDVAKMKIYGEPYMPGREQCAGVLTKFNPLKVERSRRMYNTLLVTLRPGHVDSFLKLDGTKLGNAKLVVRSSLTPEYRIKGLIVNKIKEFFGLVTSPSPVDMEIDDEMDEEGEEDDEEELDEEELEMEQWEE